MRSIKIGLALMAALVFSAAMTASASATLSFLSSKKGPLLSENVEKQVFKTNAGTTECTGAKIKAGESSGTETNIQLAEIEYEGCTAFGFVEVKISPADYDFLATDGLVHILKLISIVTSGCEISVPPQLVGTVLYDNTTNKEGNGNIKLLPQVTGIKYKQNGSLFSCKNEEASNGKYEGNAEAMIVGGSLSFMP